MPLQALTLNLSGVLERAHELAVPPYQRAYRWSNQEADKALDDLIGAIAGDDEDGADALNPKPSYFLGPIILAPSADGGSTDIIDGVQRLTTLTILIACLRDLLAPDSPDVIDDLLYLAPRPDETEKVPRLRVRSNERDFFNQHILTPGGTAQLSLRDAGGSEVLERVINVALQFRDQLRQRQRAFLLRLLELVAYNTMFVVLEVVDPGLVFKIFDTMNRRGLPLSPVDVLRHRSIWDAPNDQAREERDRLWREAEQDLGEAGLREWAIAATALAMGDRTFKGIAEHLRLFETNADVRTRFYDHFDRAVYVLRQVNSPGYALDEESWRIKQSFNVLSLIDHWEWRPALLSVFYRNGVTQSQKRAFIESLEAQEFSFLLNGSESIVRLKRFRAMAREFNEQASAAEIRASLVLPPDDIANLHGRLMAPTFGRLHAGKILPVLMRLNVMMAETGKPVSFRPDLDTEHVLPKSPGRNPMWMHSFRDERVRQQVTDQLGNLVAVPQALNKELGNRHFEDKRARLVAWTSQMALPHTETLAAENAWTPEVIEHRTKHFADMFVDFLANRVG